MLPLFYDLLSGRFRRSLTRLGRSFGRFRTALLGRSAFVAAFGSDGRCAVLLGIRKHGGLVAVQYLLVPFHALKALCSRADSIGVFGVLQLKQKLRAVVTALQQRIFVVLDRQTMTINLLT